MFLNSPVANENEVAHEAFGFDNIDQFSKPRDVEQVVSRVVKCLQSITNDWKERYVALQLLALLTQSAIDDKTLHKFIIDTIITNDSMQKTLCIALIEQVSDNRSEIVKQTSNLIQMMATVFKKKFRVIAKRIAPTIIKCVGVANETIRQHCIDAAIKMIQHCHSYSLFESVYKAFQLTKNSDIQENCIIFFKIMLRVWPIKNLLKSHQCKEFESFIKLALQAKTPQIRHCAGTCFWYFIYAFPHRESSLYKSLTLRKQAIVNKEKRTRIDQFETIQQLTKTHFIKHELIPEDFANLLPHTEKYHRNVGSRKQDDAYDDDPSDLLQNVASIHITANSSQCEDSEFTTKTNATEDVETSIENIEDVPLQPKKIHRASSANVSNVHSPKKTAGFSQSLSPKRSPNFSSTVPIKQTLQSPKIKTGISTLDINHDKLVATPRLHLSPSLRSDNSEIETIFKVDFDEYKAGHTNRETADSTSHSELSSLSQTSRKKDMSSMDTKAIRIHTEWNRFKSHTYQTLAKIEKKMNDINTIDDIDQSTVSYIVKSMNNLKAKTDSTSKTFQSLFRRSPVKKR